MKSLHYLSLALLVAFSGCGKKYYAINDFPSVAKFDAHVHISSDKHDFEEQAKLDNFGLLTINTDFGTMKSVTSQLEYASASVKQYPGMVYYAATFRFDTIHWENKNWSDSAILQLKQNTANGAVAVKFWKNIGMTEKDHQGHFIMVDNEKLDPVINYLVSSKLTLVGHFGEPKNCWLPVEEMTVAGDKRYFSENPQYHMFKHPECPTYDQQIAARDHMLEKHPDLVFVGCHLGSLEWSVDELSKRLDKFPNMAVDMAGRICHLQYQSMHNRDRVRNFILKYQDRLIYGTDLEANENSNPQDLKNYMHKVWTDDWKYFVSDDTMNTQDFEGQFTGLKLPCSVINKIYKANAVKWYNLK